MYRIKNIKTGLYYQPSKSGCNLSPRGKVYTTKTNPLTMDRGTDYIDVSFAKSNRVTKTILKHYPLPADWIEDYGDSLEEVLEWTQVIIVIPKSDFIIEEI